MKKSSLFFSVGNDFYKDKLELLKKELENGQRVDVSVACIGHTRNNMTQEAYRQALVDYYGDKLEVQYNDGVCSYSYTYELKEKDL